MQMQTVPNEEKSNLFLQASVSKVAKKLTDRDKGKKSKYLCHCNQIKRETNKDRMKSMIIN